MGDSYRAQALAWREHDPDPQTRAEVTALLEAGDDAALADRFGARLEFGTAGLRGELGAGPNRMNRVTVMRAAAGVARWAGAGATVVIGYDARHRSADFARDSAAVLTGAGCTALLLPRPLPTPVLAHTVRDLAADAGIMVTASHNPPRDNGYKVYAGGAGPDAGAQIVPPADTAISAAIDAVEFADRLPMGTGWQVLGEEVVDRYLSAVGRLPLGGERDVTTAYTPLHGVGGATLATAFARAGFPAPVTVLEQAEPDPDFPTVEFPNPEEPGAMDLALALGRDAGTDIVLANDPDADRLAVGVPGHGLLTGDQVGGLLAEYVLERTSGADRMVATTIVSAGLLPKIAAAHGVRCAETLTGFKWLARAAGPGERCVFAYEEALGYCLAGDAGRPVADKDGIGAALAVAAMAAEAKRAGRTLLDLLDDQARRYGLHATAQESLRVADRAVIGGTLRRLRAWPPRAFGDLEVEGVEDFAEGRGGLPATDALRYRLGGPARGRVTLRPSGTEPKLKAYLEVVLPVESAGPAAARARAGEHLADLRAAVRELFPA
ncbi:phospho-sugar mutase [Streptomonospora nanhaiensis]|uniref:phospho-sugar mutase n=1 Tax=Streptomonospora nanhaiensis TaxID=1323731 RepID=UPI001C99ED7D|nr:phospho-sugar mutase [Streptomonospora nanhaiensis]MBX9391911.1 phospho-sugar mutase [Streptomonospora nanhaiensis]